jgi:hypothetical protein
MLIKELPIVIVIEVTFLNIKHGLNKDMYRSNCCSFKMDGNLNYFTCSFLIRSRLPTLHSCSRLMLSLMTIPKVITFTQ